jgi:hypothetical protein
MAVLGSLLFFTLFQTVGFEPPRLQRSAPVADSLNIVASSWVTMDLEIDREGKTTVRALEGPKPFRDMALGSVRQWAFTPARTEEPVESRAFVVFLFRPRDLFPGAGPQLPKPSSSHPDRPPLPLRLSDPGYPTTSVGEGAVVLELGVGQTGTIESVRGVTTVAGLTAFTEKVVRTWRFEPAMRKGKAVPGTVIAVVSYLRPVLYTPSGTGR